MDAGRVRADLRAAGVEDTMGTLLDR
jgi:hypothetical protein